VDGKAGPIAAYFKNGIGNLVMMTPALQAFRACFPGSSLHVFVDRTEDVATNWDAGRKAACIEALVAMPFVDRVVEWPDAEVDLLLYAAWYASPHGEGGVTKELFQAWGAFDRIKSRDWFADGTHEVEHYLSILVDRFGWVGAVPGPFFPVSDKVRAGRRKRGLRVALCNSFYKGNPMWSRKGWSGFPELAELLRRFLGAEIVCLGGPDDLGWATQTGGRDLVGRYSITGTAKVLSSCDLLVSTDTGMASIAAALGVPVITLFGPSNPLRSRPWRKRVAVVVSQASCAGCRDRGKLSDCREEYPAKCMLAITPGQVMASVREMLR
jgi:ADP-heptose:LPS heptosyltransferase